MIIYSNSNAQSEMGFEQYDPVSTLVVPKHEIVKAKFPFIDIHSHQWNMDSQDLKDLISSMNEMNMRVMVNLSGGSGNKLLKAVANGKNNFPGRFIVFANIDFQKIGSPGWTEKAVQQLRTDVKNGASGLKIFENLGTRVLDTSGKRVPVDDPRLAAIWDVCGELGIPVLIHTAAPKA
ncbi:MAG TPA: hypothetical protein VJM08_14905, partial [Anaerolineales bacterium]|nr:hypothetical protein [Anaerolineales bacterium]